MIKTGYTVHMTLTSRNRIIKLGLVTSALLAAFTIIFLVRNYNKIPEFFDTVSIRQIVWFLYIPAHKNAVVVSTLGTVFTVLFSFCGASVLYVSFRKTASSEIFFFIIFILSFAFEGLRLLQLVAYTESDTIFTSLLISRGIYFFRFFRLLCLFTSSLFTLNFQYQRFSVILGLCFLVSFPLALIIPFESTIMMTNFIHKIADEKGFFVTVIIIQLLTIINYLRAGTMSETNDYYYNAAAMAFIIIGANLLFYMSNGITITAGAILLTLGSVIFARRMHKIYLWS